MSFILNICFYLDRDCHHLGIKNGFDHNRYIMFARVIEVDGRLQICTRDKEVPNIYEMFHTRTSLHRKACQHKINKVIQLMIRDALLKADEKLKISKAIDNMEEYIKVTDSVFEKILYSTEDELKGAREILQNILSRKLYRCLGETKLTDELATEKEQWTSEMTSINKQGHTENDFEIKFKKKWKSELAAMPTYKEEEQLIEDNFEIIITTFDFGKKEKNPMDNLYVYNKFDNEKAFKIPSEQVFQFLLPNRFSEKWISVYYTSWDKKTQGIAQKNFYEWCQRKNVYLSPSPPQLLTVDQQPKAFRDNVHGQVEFHPFLVKIIDTPQFQRLRYLKQLGCAYFVYPGASHNRFEHSLGVAHLAGQFVRSLKEKQGELGITDRDILCVQIAGLCHDLGHGPFSHMFDDMFMPLAKPKAGWKHEKGSVEMFDHIVDYLKGHGFDLKSELKNLSKNDGDDQSENSDSDDLEFIKEMINGPKEKGRYTGRPSNKSFLYEIVSNKRNGVGVDKFDYFARDCHHLGIKNGFDHNRYIMFARVIEVDGLLQICTRDKEVPNIYEMFHTRSSLHRKVYQHKTNKAIELMIRDALLKADEKLKISKAIDNMEEYIKVTDSVFEKILYSTEDELKGAREILQNILSRKLYRCLGETKWTDELAKKVKDLEKENIEILITTFDFGQKEENPMDKLYVYKKSDNKKALPIEQVSQFLLPYKFSEKWIRAYCKSCDSDTLTKAQDMFKKWKQPSSESTSVAN